MSKSYDYLNRLTQISSAPTASSSLTFTYPYNSAGQRYRAIINSDQPTSYWQYQYDSLGQLVSGKKAWWGGGVIPGQQFEYGFDTIGNRKYARSGGDVNGANLRQSDYTANALNQYSSRTVPGYVDVLGEATNAATVTVNKQATTRQGDYYRAELTVGNSSPVWQGITNIAVLNQGSNPDLIATNLGNVLVPQTPESFTYDDDGNLTSDSLWTNVWNGENRRVTVESRSTVPTGGKAREEWTHLPDGRWIERIVSTNNGSGYVAAFTNRFVWDGNVLLAVLNHTNGLELAFMRGLDLSGTLQGAGGVGGLLAVHDSSTLNYQPSTHFAGYDGNGNVVLLANAADGKESARYEYGPFAEPLRVSGVMGKANPIRFSTQYADDVTGDVKYLYRDYRADTGRWPNRDPLGEPGFETLRRGISFVTGDGPNLYAFTGNNPVCRYDYLGLKCPRLRPDFFTNPPGFFDPVCSCKEIAALDYQNDWYHLFNLYDSTIHRLQQAYDACQDLACRIVVGHRANLVSRTFLLEENHLRTTTLADKLIKCCGTRTMDDIPIRFVDPLPELKTDGPYPQTPPAPPPPPRRPPRRR